MNVMIVHPNFKLYGGAEHLIVKLCNHLTSNNIQNAIVTTSINQNVIDDLNHTKIIQTRPVKKSKITLLNHINIANALRIQIQIYSNHYDIINVHNFPAELAVRGIDKPVVWMCNEPPHCSLELNPIDKLFLQFEKHIVNNNIDDVVVADPYNQKRFGKLYNLQSNIINYGIDCDLFNVKSTATNHYFNIVQVGTVTPFKNQLKSIQAVEQLIIKIPKIHLVLVGDDNSQYAKELKQYVKDHDLNHHVVFMGNITQQDLRLVYAVSNLAVFPGKEQGGWLSPFEAMCAGLPVIVSEELPCSDIIKLNGLGHVTNNLKSTILASAIFDIYDSNVKFDIEFNRNWIKSNLTWELFGDNIIKQFEDTINFGCNN